MRARRILATIFAVSLAGGLFACDRVPEEMDEEPAAPTAQYETDKREAEQEPTEEGESADEAAVTVKVDDKEPFGAFLTDNEGMSLYLFEADSPAETTCYDDCAQAWPPLVVDGDVAAGEGADSEKLSTIERRDGQKQVTYGGWPLYYFAQDKEPGDTGGQDVEGFGAEWYLISPDGEKVHAEGQGS